VVRLWTAWNGVGEAVMKLHILFVSLRPAIDHRAYFTASTGGLGGSFILAIVRIRMGKVIEYLGGIERTWSRTGIIG
jgi:hypothetical protein